MVNMYEIDSKPLERPVTDPKIGDQLDHTPAPAEIDERQITRLQLGIVAVVTAGVFALQGGIGNTIHLIERL